MTMGRIYAIGEALIDFIPVQPADSLAKVNAFEKRPGGAPANVAVAAAKLGAESYFIGMVGDDPFGHFMKDTIQSYGVNTQHIKMTKEAKTALAFVTLSENGQRDFSFYRNPSADLLLKKEDVEDIIFTDKDFISFCSVDLVDYPVKYATEYLLQKAKQAGATILFDPNIRKDLWDDLDACKNTVLSFMKYADIVKMADDEVSFITGKTDVSDAIAYVKGYGVKHVIITRGPDGSDAYLQHGFGHADSHKVTALDTTGAGDTFVGALLYYLNAQELNIDKIPLDTMKNALKFANCSAAIVATKKGAMNAAPTLEEVLELDGDIHVS